MNMMHLRYIHLVLGLTASLLTTLWPVTVTSYNWHTGGRPQVDRRAIAGIWHLSTKPRPVFPMKEFTVYPKKKQANKPGDDLPELLLNLKEDGSFQQCSGTSKENAVDVDASWSQFQKLKESKAADLLKGTWDYVDGKLILAADRPLVTPTDDVRQSARMSRLQPGSSSSRLSKNKPDTLLEGRVVANYETRLEGNPALATKKGEAVQQGENTNENRQSPNRPSSSSSSTIALDTHLSVPKGSIKVGRFFYPRNHPSFFEQPMFGGFKQGSFSLRQVLGSLNTAMDQDDEIIEKFKCSDFYNKTFLLTSHPIGFNQQPNGRERWSIRQNKMVHDPPSKAAAKAANAEQNRPANIRVMQVQFHANNTFSTTGGLGESILRGKFDVIGQDKDQLWFQVWRFGFGRSVSGSVYSEGRMLTHEDAKVYWGHIRYEEKEQDKNDNMSAPVSEKEDSLSSSRRSLVESPGEAGTHRLEVKGSVMFGWGIEPVPEARFIMRELTSIDTEEEEDDEDEDDIASLNSEDSDLGEGGIDWPSEGESFQ